MSVKRASLGVFYPVSHHDPHRRGRRPHAYYLGFVKIEGGAAEAVLLTDRELSVFRARVDACWKNLTHYRPGTLRVPGPGRRLLEEPHK